jgi:bifunctional non-homologous end joining protein LigD
MLCQAGELPADPDGWAAEIKWDGIRALCHLGADRQARIYSRSGRQITVSYPEIARVLERTLAPDTVLDGELCAFGPDGLPSLALIQRRSGSGHRQPGAPAVTLIGFDLLRSAGETIIGLGYDERRARLADTLTGAHAGLLLAPSYVDRTPEAVFDVAKSKGLEGIVCKRRDGRYQPGKRSRTWVKLKAHACQEFVVGGFQFGSGSRARQLGALLLGVHDPDGTLAYVGAVGTGFDHRELRLYASILPGLHSEGCPFGRGGPPRRSVWLRPELVVQVRFLCFDADGKLREPSYQGRRDDVAAATVMREVQSVQATAPSVSVARA